MRIPTKFKNSLQAAYTDSRKINNIFIENKDFLTNLAKYFAHRIHISSKSYIDYEDVYQVICMVIIDKMWEYDDSHGYSLGWYILYQVGIEIQHLIRATYAKKRKGDMVYVDGYEKAEVENFFKEKYPGLNFEERMDIAHTINEMKKDSPLEARVLKLLVKHEGNVTSVAKEIKEKNIIRGYKKKSVDTIRVTLKNNSVKEIRSRFADFGIISSGSKKQM